MKIETKVDMAKSLIKSVQDFVKPIDCEALIKAGAIKREGLWYRILNPKLVPEHFTKKISRSIFDQKGLKVKLFSQSRIDSLEKKYKSKGII